MFEEKTSKFSVEIREMFLRLNDLVFAVAPTAQAKMWAGLPSYYAGDRFVRIIPFKDHINVEATAIIDYKAQLFEYKFTPKNMLQICVGQTIPSEILTKAFGKTLSE